MRTGEEVKKFVFPIMFFVLALSYAGENPAAALSSLLFGTAILIFNHSRWY